MFCHCITIHSETIPYQRVVSKQNKKRLNNFKHITTLSTVAATGGNVRRVAHRMNSRKFNSINPNGTLAKGVTALRIAMSLLSTGIHSTPNMRCTNVRVRFYNNILYCTSSRITCDSVYCVLWAIVSAYIFSVGCIVQILYCILYTCWLLFIYLHILSLRGLTAQTTTP